MDGIKAWLKGKKTYLVAGVGIITAAVAWAEGGIDLTGFLQTVWAAVLVFTGRAAVAKIEEKVS